ncbi:MAG: colanic acid biosynthesis glycosyltransferase WcaL, partial [Candidatus Electrothrix sp. AS4_5]|nr:colanic acid biosynthesis glycosyltransferase WcaL [Candidatus Electrothrix gigas]
TDQDLLDQTFYLATASPLFYLKAHLKKIFISPRRYAKGLASVFLLRDKQFPGLIFKNIIRFIGAIALTAYLEEKKISHIHVHFAFGAAGVALFLKAVSDITYSISIHGSDVLLPQPLTGEKLQQARFIISNCRFHIQNLIDRYPFLANQHFYPIYLGVDTSSKFWAGPSKVTDEGMLLRILNVAMLKPVKGHDILLHACSKLQKESVRFNCRIVGEGPERIKLEKLINQLNLNDSIELLGRCYENDVSNQYDWSHITVLSSYSEGTPMAIIEAMMKGRPVVAPRITAIPEMIVEGENGLLFTKASADDLAAKLAVFSEKPELITSMGKKGRKRAESLFDLRQNAQKMIAVFNKNIEIAENT